MFTRLAVRATTTAAVAFALSALAATGTQAAPAGPGPGNSPNAKQCYKGGWQNLVGANGVAFAGEAECVAYAAKGGVLAPKPAASLVITFTGCTGDTIIGCEFASIAGSGLQPGAPVFSCRDGECIPDFPNGYVQQDGTYYFEGSEAQCVAGSTYIYRSTTASGTTIDSNSFHCAVTD